ncbi:hypothetical protein AMTRI_Chr03g143910 [Amborella trichopoda]
MDSNTKLLAYKGELFEDPGWYRGLTGRLIYLIIPRHDIAFVICEWMRDQQHIKLLPGDYALHLDLVAKVRGLASAEKFFEDLPEKMKEKSTYTSLLNAYVQNKLSTKAEALMAKMSECGLLKSPLPYNHMLNLYVSNGQFEKIPLLVQKLKAHVLPDLFTYNIWMSAYASKNDIKGAESVLLELKRTKLHADWVTYSILASIYIKANDLNKAADALKEMELRVSRKERVAYCSLLTLNTNLGSKDVYRIWKKMKLTFRKLNDSEYTCMLVSLVKLGDIEGAENVFSEWESVSGTRDSRVSNVLLSAYVRNDMSEKAEEFHKCTVERGTIPSYTTWETLAWGYLREKKIVMALDSLKNAVSSVKKWEPNRGLVREFSKTLEESGDTENAENFLLLLRDVNYVSTAIYNSVLRTYASAGKMPLIILERMRNDKVEPDEETHKLLKVTSKLCVGGVARALS